MVPLSLREALGGKRLLLSTLHKEEYEFLSPSSVAIAELVALFLEGLKERSVFAMALQDRKATGAQLGGVGGHVVYGRAASSQPRGSSHAAWSRDRRLEQRDSATKPWGAAVGKASPFTK